MKMATVLDCEFRSGGEVCAGTLYLPDGSAPAPVVVMGHGLGALKEFRLGDFARRFVDSGLAVFTFDYRHWGGSGGTPRQLLLPKRQLEDWHAALGYVRGLDAIDGDHLGIWGSSFGGAHVIHVAAQDHAVKAVVAQVLAADTASAVASFGLPYLFKSTASGVLDALRGMLGLSPLYFPLVGKPGETAVMNTPECWEGYLGLVPEDAPWENRIAARSLLHIPSYRAIKVAPAVQAPTLLMGGVHDSLVAIDDIRKMAAVMPQATLREYDCNHFEPYYAPLFETFVSTQADFFVEHLCTSCEGPPAAT